MTKDQLEILWVMLGIIGITMDLSSEKHRKDYGKNKLLFLLGILAYIIAGPITLAMAAHDLMDEKAKRARVPEVLEMVNKINEFGKPDQAEREFLFFVKFNDYMINDIEYAKLKELAATANYDPTKLSHVIGAIFKEAKSDKVIGQQIKPNETL